jgi:hypothetical protein
MVSVVVVPRNLYGKRNPDKHHLSKGEANFERNENSKPIAGFAGLDGERRHGH